MTNLRRRLLIAQLIARPGATVDESIGLSSGSTSATIPVTARITEDSIVRVTEDGQTRVIE